MIFTQVRKHMMLKPALLGLALTLSALQLNAQARDISPAPEPNKPTELTNLTERFQSESAAAYRGLDAGALLLQKVPAKDRAVLLARQKAAEAALKNRSEALLAVVQSANTSRDASSTARLQNALGALPVRIDADIAPVKPVARSLPSLRAGSSVRLPPSAVDLAASLDAPIIPLIQAKADALGRSPVAIFEWVRKNISYVPSQGSLQGALGTLESGRGNAVDTASLLVALLRASGVHARYVQGQVSLSADAAMRWLGVDRPDAVAALLTEGGIAFDSTVAGGTLSEFRFEHTWVEAWVDFVPSRGAKHQQGDAWVALDASFKSHDVLPGQNLQALMALNPSAMATTIGSASTYDASLGYLSAISASVMSQQMQLALTALTQGLAAQNLAISPLRTLYPNAKDNTPAYPFFLGTLSYQVSQYGDPVPVLPDSQRYRMRLSIQADDNGQPGQTILTLDQPMVALAGKSLSLAYSPASSADQAAILAALPSAIGQFADLPESLPAYLIELKAGLTLDGVLLSETAALNLGRALYATQTIVRPDGVLTRQTWGAFVGEPRALGLAFHGGHAGSLKRHTNQLIAAQTALGTGNALAGSQFSAALLALIGDAHFANSDAYQAWLAGPNRVAFYRAPSANTSYAALDVEAPLGLITTVHLAGAGVSDVSPNHIGANLKSGDEQRFVSESLIAQAAFGHQLLEQMWPGAAAATGRSAGQLYSQAMRNNSKIYTLDSASSTPLLSLNLPSVLATPLAASLSQGDRITVTQSPQNIGDVPNRWTGFGASMEYPNALGGSSLIYGSTRSGVQSQITGASIGGSSARSLLIASWLGGSTPPALLALWPSALEPALGAGTGLQQIANDPLSVAASSLTRQIMAGTVLHQQVGPLVDSLVDQHLWLALLGPALSISQALDPEPPVLTFSVNPKTINLTESTQINAAVTDNRPGASLLLTADGQTLALSPNPLSGQISYTPSRAGRIVVIASARDAAGNIVERQDFIDVRDPNDLNPPVVHMTSPEDDADVTKPTNIIGDVTDNNLRKWTLYLRPGNSPEIEPIELATGTQNMPIGSILGKLDPTMMFNGVYIVILQAEDANGQTSSDSIAVRLDGDMKLGHFSISFEEIEIPLQGIPIRITRTYDTRQNKEELDFGFGWSIDYQNVRIRESRKLGFSWKLSQAGGGFNPFCIKANGVPAVTITLPNGEVEQFEAKWQPECRQYLPPVYGELVFVAKGTKTHSKLEQLSYGTLRAANLADGSSNIIELEESTPVDPSLYQLTTEDGMVYLLDQKFGIRKITDQAGNTITYTDAGIEHSSGTRVDFVRDTKNRITDIVLPDGRRLKYQYDLKGDLLAVKDPLELATTFSYLENIRYPHYLKDITDARRIKAIRHEYDEGGRLVASTDANNQRVEYTHNVIGQTEIVKNRRGQATTYVYDDNGWVILERNSLGEEKTWTYDRNGSVLSQTDALGRKTEFTVDVRGNVLTEKDPLGNITTRNWGFYNQMYTEVDALGRTSVRNKYKRNLVGEDTSFMVESADALDNKTYFGLDLCNADPRSCGGSGNIKQIVDPNLSSTSFVYDRKGNVTTERDSLGNTTTREYDTMGRVTSEKRTRLVAGVTQDLITRYKYDAKGNLIETIAPDGVTTKTTYNAIDKVATETDPEGRITRYEYTARGEPSKVIYPDGSFTETTYDPDGNTISQKDRLGRETKMVYDAVSRLLETIEPDTTPANAADNPRTRTIYDAAGQVSAQIDAKGNRTEFKYDLAGRQIEVKDALGNVMTTQYDVAGQRVSSTDALGRKMLYVYDLAGRMVETIYPDPIAEDADLTNNPRTKVTLDPGGRKIAETDEMGRITRYQYDKLSRLITVVLPNPTSGANPEPIDGVLPSTAGTLITKYEYDEQGNKTAQIDALGRTTRWNYDQSGRNLTRTLPMGQVETQHYSSTGERTKHTSFNGIDTQFSYDNLGRMDKITFPNNRVRQFTYDTAGRTTQINDGGQIYQFNYDERDRLVEAIDPYSRSLNYQYDINGNRTQAKTDKQQIDFTFDELNRLKELTAQVNNQPGQITKYAYTEVGSRASQTNPNGTQVSYQYDRRNRLKGLVHHASQAANAAILLSLSYTVDTSGLRTQIAETRPGSTVTAPAITRNTVYQYDAVKRLKQETVSGSANQGRSSAWTYDAVGNRLTDYTTGNIYKYVTYAYDNNDRMTRETGSSGGNKDYSYDQNGNTVQMKQGTAITSYRWDEENRMFGATVGNKTMSYAYDPNGIRRSQEVAEGSNRTRTEYLVDPNQSYAQVVEEWNASGGITGALPDESLSVSYIYGDDLISQTTAALGALPAQTSVYHYDGLGTTRALSNLAAAITDRYAYTAFGETDAAGTSGNNSGTTTNNYLYTGEQKDPNLGFYYLRARYMNPGTGGFISQDSYMGHKASPVTLNKYIYANSVPTRFIDPSGNVGVAMMMSSVSVIASMSNIASPSYVAIQTKVNRDMLHLLSGFKRNNEFSKGIVVTKSGRNIRIKIDLSARLSNLTAAGASRIGWVPTEIRMFWSGARTSPDGRRFTIVTNIAAVANWQFSDFSIGEQLGGCDTHINGDAELGGESMNICNNSPQSTSAHEFGHLLGFGHNNFNQPGQVPSKNDIMHYAYVVGRSVQWYHLAILGGIYE